MNMPLYGKVGSLSQPEEDDGAPVPGQSERELISRCLAILDLPTDQNFLTHFQAFVSAQRIYARRYSVYQDKPIHEMGFIGVLVQARTCVGRLWARYGPGTTQPTRAVMVSDLNDAYDAINYLAHFITQFHAGNEGDWGWE